MNSVSNSESGWLATLAARVVCNALAGGVLVAMVGALCVGAAGAMVGALLDYRYASFYVAHPNGFTMSPDVISGGLGRLLDFVSWLFPNGITLWPDDAGVSLVVFSSAGAGLFVGGLVGATIFGVAAFKAPPGRFYAPIESLVGRVMLGQIAGTLGAISFFGALVAFKMLTQGQSLLDSTDSDLNILFLGTPALMICGAIAGALSKRPPRQSATLKGE